MRLNDYIEALTVDEMARWLCLLEGVNVVFSELERQNIEDSIEENKKMFNKIDRSLNKYIRDRFHTMKSDILIEYAVYPKKNSRA